MLVEDETSSGREEPKQPLVGPEYGPSRPDGHDDIHSHPGESKNGSKVSPGLPGLVDDHLAHFRLRLEERFLRFRAEHQNPTGVHNLPVLEFPQSAQSDGILLGGQE